MSKNLIGDDLYSSFINIFPEELWKRVGVKEDSRIKNYKYSSFYVNVRKNRRSKKCRSLLKMNNLKITFK